MNIGQRIKERRLELGLSVDDIAAKIGKNRATVYRYESNEIEDLPTSVLEPLAKALSTTPSYLMGWNNNQKSVSNNSKNKTEDIPDDEDESLIILNRNARKMTTEQRKKLIEMAKVMFKEEFDDWAWLLQIYK